MRIMMNDQLHHIDPDISCLEMQRTDSSHLSYFVSLSIDVLFLLCFVLDTIDVQLR